jgi:aerobic-type carbon monoxide dehydrogenase small subunit (CoxS/CutS family)
MVASFRINGKDRRITFGSRSTLLEVLRAQGYTEVKEGCREGQCGSCVVLLDGKLVNSCQVLAASASKKNILTVRGLGDVLSPHPIQRAFAETGAIQCGFCTPGMILAAYSLLLKNPDPDEEAVKRALDGNLCRCTGYVKIVEAVLLAARRMRGNE